MNFRQVLDTLNAHKRDGTWQRVAKATGLHYDTIARIARGAMARPSVQVVESIAAALQEISDSPSEAKEAA